jgi:phosphoribosylformimino-5-aminoimidazole carboxamide ribotide isomerase
MLLYPAIDLMDGHVVRLKQGLASQKTVYSNDPATFAKRWESEGGHWLHVVDLDAAFSGTHQNLESIRKITSALSIPVQMGGGMRSEQAVENALNAGVSRVVIGTRAAESIDFVASLVQRFGPDRIAVGIDAKNGLVAVKGWTETSTLPAITFAKDVHARGVKTVIYTDIATDGMMQGPNFQELDKMLGVIKCKLIASGGVSSFADVQRLSQHPRIHGAIIGKALYDSAIRLHLVSSSRRLN